LIHLGN